jgi:hypothetical protein
MKDQYKSLIFALVASAALLTMLWFFIDAVIDSINKLQSAIAGSIIAATIAAAAAFLVNVYAKHQEAKERILQEIRIKKTIVYEELIDIIFSAVMGEKQGKPKPSEAELTKRFAQLTPKVVIWGSEELITQWNKTRLQSTKPTDNPIQVFEPWNELLRVIRKDLGHSNKKLEKWALMRLFVNDIPQ